MEKTFLEWLAHFNCKPNLYDRYHKAMIDKLEAEKVSLTDFIIDERIKNMNMELEDMIWNLPVRRGLTL